MTTTKSTRSTRNWCASSQDSDGATFAGELTGLSQEIDEGDQAILDSYMPQGQLQGGQTLADLIMQKIDEQEGANDEPLGTLNNRRPRGAC